MHHFYFLSVIFKKHSLFMKKAFLLFALPFLLFSCADDSDTESAYTGNEIQLVMIPGTVQGNTTTGNLTVKERTDGLAEVQIELENVLKNASHPVHLHFGDLAADGNVATYLSNVTESGGTGKSTTILRELDNGTIVTYNDFLQFDGSIKVHFEASGPLEDEILGSTNIGINEAQNAAYLTGERTITSCNSNF